MGSRLLSGALACVIAWVAGPVAAQDDSVEIKVHNTCDAEMYMMVRYMPRPGDWRNAGWYTFAPGETAFLSHDGARIRHEFSKYLYAYADTADGRGYFDTNHDPQTRFSVIPISDRGYVLSTPAFGDFEDGAFLFEMTCRLF
ncbi:hypothetical protein K1T73_09405 [Roseovarius sp. SCSIO 43702]|uniref:hypothetical protein n=1 Tax=Roseovarius sp. SCSIO 43702 TaxID=2823043 RepID=UPI001C72ACA8|nr:hypothetical protein [Roseovarius sp. SCSIO 43702]QYX55332.1 hypothetical protein K1T73_09405 [Roseovarius sp. SCSIO 43702]